MLFWIGIAVAIVGVVLYALSHTLLFPGVQRLINKNPAKLQRMLDSGEARKLGEGAEDLLKDAIKYQLENQVGPVPLARPATILIVVGALVAVVGYFLG